jgi:hypothetical protein
MKTVTLKNGEVWNSKTTKEEGAFVVLNDGRSEVRIPTSNIARIESQQEESGVGAAIVGSLILAAITGGVLS